MNLEYIQKLPPITEEDRQLKAWNETNGGESVDLGEDIEIKEKLAKKFHWRKAEKPLVRVLLRSGNIILYKDDYYHYMMDLEQSKEYGDYEELVKRK